jgi:hypothetical protein
MLASSPCAGAESPPVNQKKSLPLPLPPAAESFALVRAGSSNKLIAKKAAAAA